MSWRDRLVALRKKTGEPPVCIPPKLTKAPFVSSGRVQTGPSQEKRNTFMSEARLVAGPTWPTVATALDAVDLADLQNMTDPSLRAYARAATWSALMAAGVVPRDFTKRAECPKCGPVLIPEALSITTGCPWCAHRKAGRPIPRPAVRSGR